MQYAAHENAPGIRPLTDDEIGHVTGGGGRDFVSNFRRLWRLDTGGAGAAMRYAAGYVWAGIGGRSPDYNGDNVVTGPRG